jgi:predicted ATPase/class 3 adenylate cyclase/DNA-binding CsgD family transcriptional regulator
MSSELPQGVVTFLMTDVEGSTRIWQEASDAARLMARQAELVGEAIAKHGGARPADQGEGDSLLAAFARPADALAAALAAQRALAAEPWPEGRAFRVRMAVLTGEAELRDARNYGGLALIGCARLRDRARGGQVLVSAATVDLAGDRLPAGASFVELGSFELDGLPRPQRVLQLCHPALPALAAPLGGNAAALPVWPTPLIGRAAERAELAGLLSAHRLVTLTGVGGSGKTRLAHAVAEDFAGGFAEGVVWVELARLASGEQLAPAVLAACGAREAAGMPALEVLAHHLASRELLLVLDNCEHLLAAASELADAVLRAAANVRMLATSREPLGVAGEASWRIPSLALPAEAETDAERIAESEAVRLFAARAAAARREFALDAATAPVVARICRRLDGIPLALELAAARTRALSLEQLAGGLDDRFRLLTGGARTAVARQRTLLASVQWSHELLDEDERTLFRRLSVFAAPFGLEAAEAVASDEAIDSLEVFDLLARLVDKSLVVHAGDRYRLLETLRQYAEERADEASELPGLRDRHLAWCERRARDWRLDREIATAEQLAEVAAEAPDLVAALDWSVGRPAGPSLPLLHALDQHWISGQRYAEVRAVAGRVLGALEPGSPRWLAALEAVAQTLLLSGEFAWLADAKRGLEAAGEDLDTDLRVFVEAAVAAVQPVAEGGPLVLSALERAIARGRAAGNRKLAVRTTVHLAGVAVHAGELRRAVPLLAWLDQHLAASAWPRSLVALMQSLAAALSGDLAGARERAVAALERGGHTGVAGVVGRVAFWTGDAALLERSRRSLGAEAAPGSIAASLADELRGLALLLAGELAAARSCFERCWILSTGLGMQRLAIADIALAQGDLAAVREQVAETDRRYLVVDAGEGTRPPAFAALADLLRARLLRASGEIVRGEAAAHAALATAMAQGLALYATDALEALALFAAERGDRSEAARRLGAAESFCARSGYRWRAWDLRPALDALRPQLDPAMLAEGAGLSLPEAAALAQRGRGARGRPDHGWDALTPTEARVVELVAAGLPNHEIAKRMFVSLATVKSHLVHVFQKLDVRSRAELAVAALRRRERG